MLGVARTSRQVWGTEWNHIKRAECAVLASTRGEVIGLDAGSKSGVSFTTPSTMSVLVATRIVSGSRGERRYSPILRTAVRSRTP